MNLLADSGCFFLPVFVRNMLSFLIHIRYRIQKMFYYNAGCAKINHAFLTGGDKSYTRPILKNYELVFS